MAGVLVERLLHDVRCVDVVFTIYDLQFPMATGLINTWFSS